MVGSSGSTNVASTTASQPKMINNPRVMRLFAPQSVAAYCSIGAAPAEYACGACFTAGSRASLRLLKSRGSLCEHSASITGVGTAIAALAAEVTPRRCANPAGALRRRPVRQPRHAAARLPPRWKEFRPAAKRRQRQPHQRWPFWPKTGGSDRCPAARAGNPGAAAQEPAEKAPRPICTTSWPSIRTTNAG